MEKTKKLHENFTEIIGKSSNCSALTSFDAKKIKQKRLEANFKSFLWRRVRDLNPRTAHHRYTISSRAPSTTQPTLHMVAEEGFEPSQTESESVVLPLHNSAMFFVLSFLANQRILLYSCWGRMSRKNLKKFMKNLHKKREILMNLRMEKA